MLFLSSIEQALLSSATVLEDGDFNSTIAIVITLTLSVAAVAVVPLSHGEFRKLKGFVYQSPWYISGQH